jgi:hypothetical protein
VKHNLTHVKHNLTHVKHNLTHVKHNLTHVKHNLTHVKHNLTHVKHNLTPGWNTQYILKINYLHRTQFTFILFFLYLLSDFIIIEGEKCIYI